MAQELDYNKLIPQYLNNEVLSGLMSNLFNRFVSSEESVLVAGRTGLQSPPDATLIEPDLERQENALVPGLYFASGTTQYLFVFNDLINKLITLDADIDDLRTWMAEQTFNYAPPINFDKFVNFQNYYWVGSSLPAGSGPSWNPNNLPEYYVIAQPRPTDSLKLPVQLASNPNADINLYFNDRPPEIFTLTFTSATSFTTSSNLDPQVAISMGTKTFSGIAGTGTPITITTNDFGSHSANAGAPSLFNGTLLNNPIATFTITPGAAAFQAGDTYTITIEYFTSNTTAVLNSGSVVGKGTITGINSIYDSNGNPVGMHIDGVAVAVSDRILVTAQTNPVQNGIYIAVSAGQWQRSADDAAGQSYTLMTVYVDGGATLAGTTWQFSSGSPQIVGTNAFNFIRQTPNPPNPFNDWQLFNYWIHKDDIKLYNDLGFTIDTSTNATVPIVEYVNTLQLNGYVDGNGNPTSSTALGAVALPQVKTRFNQLPQFDLFRYDGTHSGSTSAIWYYAVDPTDEIDQTLKFRAETNTNGDYVFGASVMDAQGRLLYWRNTTAPAPLNLQMIWYPGVTAATPSTPLFFGGANEGILAVISVVANADVQMWTVTALTPITFSVVGSRSGNIGTATISVPFVDVDELTLFITPGVNAFNVGDYWTFNVYNETAPRYVYNDSGQIINYPGGYAADQLNPTPVGCWLTPSRMFQNMMRETRESIDYGDFNVHGISILAWQNQFLGSPFGDNNARNLNFNPGYGGQIREFGSNFPLLASMLIEPDLSPITIIDFAEQQYNQALASIDQFLVNNLATYLADVGAIETTIINPAAPDILALEAYFEKLRGENILLTQVFSDTTAAVTNWPATLPIIGLLPKVQPALIFDFELNVGVILYHDGHRAVMAMENPSFDLMLTQSIVLRSDGTKSPGYIQSAMPQYPSQTPYARQLWLNPNTYQLSLFDVDFDTPTPPTGATNGQIWYNRTNNVLMIYNNGWQATAITVASRWIPMYTPAVRNSLVLAVETKLYNGIHPQQQINLNLLAPNIINSPYAELELATFAAEFNLNAFAPNYDPGNAFTWNYKQATIPPLSLVPAVWFNIYNEYFATFAGSLGTERPDIEPWKLLGFATEPGTWQATFGAPTYNSSAVTSANWVSTVNVPLSGLLTIDGNVISNGDHVLLIAQNTASQNGIWIASAGAWTRSADVLQQYLFVEVTDGYAWSGTTWTITTANPITVGVTAIAFAQVRKWLPSMWTAISTAHPTMKLCVNINTDGLIPPYVSPTQFASGEALLTVIPPGVTAAYVFGDDGPTERVWKKSLEYNYGLARSYFRLFPLQFLDASWGETYIQVPGCLRVERNLEASLPSTKFLLHGERLNLINQWTPSQTQQRVVVPTYAIVNAVGQGVILTLGTISPGSGYDGGGSAVFTNVPLTGGTGAGAQATITVTAGLVTNVVLTAGGTGYLTSDILGASSANLGGSGSGFNVAVGTANGYFSIAGNLTSLFPGGTFFIVIDSASNDGSYTVASSSFDGTNTNILITGSVPASGGGGYIAGGNITWTPNTSGVVNFTVTHTASTGQVGPLGPMGPSSTVFNVYVNGTNIGLIYEGVPFSFSNQGITFTNVTIEDLGIPFEMGDTITVNFFANTIVTEETTNNVDFIFGVLGCEGCANPNAPNQITVVSDVTNPPTYSFTPGQTKIFNGVGQWFTDLLRYTYIDTSISPAALAYRGWTVDLVHRMGALIDPTSLDINTTQGEMPQTAYNIMLKRSTNTESLWITGLRSQLAQVGTAQLNQTGLLIPTGAGADWIFTINGYNSGLPQLTYNTLNTSLGAPFQTFYALAQAHTSQVWNQYTEITGTTTVTLPITITGIQNVINFLYGYVDYVQNQGFSPNANDVPVTDQATGRTLNWQLEIEKFIDAVYSGMQAGSAYVLNPFMNALYVQTPTGLLGRYTTSAFIDLTSTQACYDVNGNAIPVSQLSIVRTDPQTVTYSKTPIFSAHVFIDQFEHAIIFNDRFTSDPTSALIFDPFLGEYINTAYLTFMRQESPNGKPTYDGFVLSADGNSIVRNVTALVENISNFYDGTQTFNVPITAQNALALLGFQQEEYFTDLDISPATQLNFWQGMIHSKGTTLAVDAFLNYKAFSQGAVDEFWAYKLATYGDAREDTMPEIKIQPQDCAQPYTQLQFYSAEDPTYNPLPLYIQIEAENEQRWFTLSDLGTVLRFDAQAISEEVTVPPSATFPYYYTLQNIYNNGDAYAPVAYGPILTVAITSPGSAYTTGSYFNVALVGGTGTGATANVVVNGIHQVSAVVIVSEGQGYAEGQTLTIPASAIGGTGTGLLLTVATIPITILTAQLAKVTQAGTYNVAGYTWLNKTKFSPVNLYNYVDEELVNQITLWHPAIGVHAYSALETINITTPYDPAFYNYSTNTTNNPNYLTLKPWADREVGRVWWDTSHLAYIPYYDATIFPDRQTRQTRWGTLADWASYNLYVWTESQYPPSEYNAQATLQQGDSSIDPSVRLSGTVGFVNYYAAQRQVTITPIAWSEAGVGNGNAHPAFGPAYFVKLYVSGSNIIADTGHLADINVVAGRELGGWNMLTQVPIGEITIGTIVGYDIGSELNGPGQPILVSGDPSISSITVSQISGSSVFGNQIGQIQLLNNNDGTTYYLRMSDPLSGLTQDVLLQPWTSTNLSANGTMTYTFAQFGLQVTAIRAATGTISAATLATALTDPSNDLYIRELVNFTTVIPLPDVVFSNNPSDMIEYGWKTWVIPTQAELSADLLPPNNQWQPYLGVPVSITVTGPVAALMSSSSSTPNTWTLSSGITINRYTSTWSPWVQLVDTWMTAISNGSAPATFTVSSVTTVNTNNLSIYANGLQLTPANYSVSGNVVTLLNTQPEGTTLTLLLRPYQPTAADLAFNPTIADNPAIQTWYKQDYQYTQLVQRNSAGAVVGTKYYFWVTGKTDPLPNQSLTLVEAAETLTTGESTFMLFSRLVADSDAASGVGYDSCAIYGLGLLVTNTDSYKLRFLRDFTLRNDPEQLKLKNVHTEWTLIRPGQTTPIPLQLWNVLTNAACGQDAGGNPLPSQQRVDYDAQFGTDTQFGFDAGQIFAPQDETLTTIIYTILNTSITITLGSMTIIDYITALNITPSTTEATLTAQWFSTPAQIRSTMSLIYTTARAQQINEIFFAVLNDALANNYEMTDLFKTSMITLTSSTPVAQAVPSVQLNEFY